MNHNEHSSEKSFFTTSKILLIGVLALGIISTAIFTTSNYGSTTQSSLAFNSSAKIKLSSFPVFKPNLKYGFNLDAFQISEGTFKTNQFLSDLLDQHHVPYTQIDNLARSTKEIFDVRKIRAGKDYMILSKDENSAADYFVYEPDVYGYIIYDLKNGTAKEVKRPRTTKVQHASGTITSSLWQTMVDNNLSYELASRLEDVFGWSIDFHHIQNGDQFKVVYEQHYIDGKPVGVGNIEGAYYKNYDNEYFGIHFENDKHNGFYDLEARPMKKNFLKSPVKYSRISSRFNRNRFHPILKRRKAHLGTDYAAPIGTPIYAVANGVVTKAAYTRGNGKYVKIKHDKTYQTQYLHMNGFAKGIGSGVHVKQGQVIGYVGKTGLATGPHVCFRFWKNGRQVNHLRLNFPPPEPMPKDDIPRFNEIRDNIVNQLNAIQYKAVEKPLSQKTDEELKKEKPEVNP